MRYFLIVIGSLALSFLFASTALAKQNQNLPKGKALGLAKQGQTTQTQGNPGAIWTTNQDGSQQNENHYGTGENVYLHGQKLPNGTLSYTIYTNPPSAKRGTVVATGTVNVLENGQLSPSIIWSIPQGASSGVYKVVLSTGSHKSDNFKVISPKPCPPPEKPPVTPPSPPPPCPPPVGGGTITLTQAPIVKEIKKLPAAGPSNFLPFILAALGVGLFLGLKRFVIKKI